MITKNLPYNQKYQILLIFDFFINQESLVAQHIAAMYNVFIFTICTFECIHIYAYIFIYIYIYINIYIHQESLVAQRIAAMCNNVYI
jgi:hypothetical protein